MNIFYEIGLYVRLMRLVIKKPDKAKIYRRQIITEIYNLGIDSFAIIAILSIFMGAVAAIQTAFNINNPLIPLYTIGFTTRQSIIMEFSPTIISLILAGKVGSRVSSEIGTMRITEQIDALEIMGVNSAGFLILPKIVACMLINPILIMASIILGIFGGWVAVITSGSVSTYHFMEGLQLEFKVYDVIYALIKTVCFAFIISSVSGFYGYYTSGGSYEVGKSSTKAVVNSSILIILFNLIITEILLG